MLLGPSAVFLQAVRSLDVDSSVLGGNDWIEDAGTPARVLRVSHWGKEGLNQGI